MEDLGSGALIDLSTHGLPKEPVVRDRIAAGADVVTFSGDKVLGGPQSGLIVGRREHIGAMASNPLHRALRCDKLTLAALEATLRLYQQAPDVLAAIPALQALARPLEEVDAAARQVAARLRETLGPGYRVEVEDSTSQVGSGALPTEEIPTRVVVVSHDRLSAGSIAARFRRAHPPIIGRIKDDRFLLDVRTVSRPADLIPAW
jgi:L-seryl-tRNA(Ser) seleniumtransferase